MRNRWHRALDVLAPSPMSANNARMSTIRFTIRSALEDEHHRASPFDQLTATHGEWPKHCVVTGFEGGTVGRRENHGPVRIAGVPIPMYFLNFDNGAKRTTGATRPPTSSRGSGGRNGKVGPSGTFHGLLLQPRTIRYEYYYRLCAAKCRISLP